MINDYPYPLPDGYECDCGGIFHDEICQECGNDPFGGPQDDEWINRAYQNEAVWKNANKHWKGNPHKSKIGKMFD